MGKRKKKMWFQAFCTAVKLWTIFCIGAYSEPVTCF